MEIPDEPYEMPPEAFGLIMLSAQVVEGMIEDVLDQIIGGTGCEKMWFDPYDGSIEICLAADAHVPYKKLAEELNRWGLPMGWLNFSDGTEQHFSLFNGGKFYERQPVQSPRWTEERRQKEYFGVEE